MTRGTTSARLDHRAAAAPHLEHRNGAVENADAAGPRAPPESCQGGVSGAWALFMTPADTISTEYSTHSAWRARSRCDTANPAEKSGVSSMWGVEDSTMTVTAERATVVTGTRPSKPLPTRLGN